MVIDTLETENSVKVLDFGIAKLAQHDEGEMQALTKTGEIFGSPLYMSPEQCQGSHVDHRSDIYSLGCVMFEALTGTTPFVGETSMTTMMMHCTATLPTLREASLGREFPPDLEEVIRSMLAKNPDQRYQNLGRAAMDLAALQRGEISKAIKPRAEKSAVTPRDTITLTRTQLGSLLFLVFAVAATAGAIITKNMEQATSIASVKASADKPSTAADKSTTDEAASADHPAKLEPSHVQQSTKIQPVGGPFDEDMTLNENRIERNIDTTDADLQHLKNYLPLQRLTINNNSGITDKGLLALKDLKLLALAVIGCENIKTGESFAQLPYLQVLYGGTTGITDDALPYLARLPMLTKLHLKNCKVTTKGLEQLAQSQSLREIYLKSDDFKPAEVAQLSKKFSYCTFPGFVNRFQFSTEDFDRVVAEGAAQPPPYKIPPQVAALPLEVQSRIVCDIADRFSKKGNLSEALALNHRSSELAEKSGDKRRMARSLYAEAKTLAQIKGPAAATHLIKLSLELAIDSMDHSLPEFYDFLYSLIILSTQARDRALVNQISRTAVDYLNALCPEDHINISRFSRLSS